jgi:glutathione S-transferase
MLKVYGMATSGNCHKVKLLLEQLQRPYEWAEIDILKGESRSGAFLAMNPMGQVPTLELKPGKYLVESNAILYYLAEGSDFLSIDPYLKAQTLSWLFFEQYSHERYIAVARFINKLLPRGNPRMSEIPALQQGGYKALTIMQQHLEKTPFFVGNKYLIVDIALYAYTHCAEDGGFRLMDFPAVNAWLQRVESQAGFVTMPN